MISLSGPGWLQFLHLTLRGIAVAAPAAAACRNSFAIASFIIRTLFCCSIVLFRYCTYKTVFRFNILCIIASQNSSAVARFIMGGPFSVVVLYLFSIALFMLKIIAPFQYCIKLCSVSIFRCIILPRLFCSCSLYQGRTSFCCSPAPFLNFS